MYSSSTHASGINFLLSHSPFQSNLHIVALKRKTQQFNQNKRTTPKHNPTKKEISDLWILWDSGDEQLRWAEHCRCWGGLRWTCVDLHASRADCWGKKIENSGMMMNNNQPKQPVASSTGEPCGELPQDTTCETNLPKLTRPYKTLQNLTKP